MNLGYACLNTVLSKNKITTNRTMRHKTFDTQGLDLVSYLAIQNVKDLKTYIQWNTSMEMRFVENNYPNLYKDYFLLNK